MINLPYVDNVSAIARRLSISVLLVGGAVRDLLLDKTPSDLDFAVAGSIDSGTAIKLARACANALDAGLFVMDVERGVARVTKPLAEGRLIMDFAQSRGNSWQDDLSERDFTINAIGYDLDQREFVDPHDGRADLSARRLRLVHPGAIAADPVRAIRGVRLAHQFGLTVEDATEQLMGAAAQLLGNISAERLRDALFDVFALESPSPALHDLLRLGLLQAIIKTHADSAVLIDFKSISNAFATVALLDAVPDRLALMLSPFARQRITQYLRSTLTDERTLRALLRLAGVLHAVFGKLSGAQLSQLGTVLRLSSDESAHLRSIFAAVPALQSMPAEDGAADAEWQYKIMRSGGQAVPSAVLLAHAVASAQVTGLELDKARAAHRCVVEQYFRRYAEDVAPMPLLTGLDVLALGLAPGPVVGQVLESVRQAQMTGKIETHAEAVDLAKIVVATHRNTSHP